LSTSDSMKPSISCQILDKALIGSKDTVIGNFEFDLGFYSIFSKLGLKNKLSVLLAGLKHKNLRTDSYNELTRIITELDEDIRTQINSYSGENLGNQAGGVKSDTYLLNRAGAIAGQIDQIIQHKETHLKSDNQQIKDIEQISQILRESEHKPEISNKVGMSTASKKKDSNNEPDVNDQESKIMAVMKKLERESVGLNQEFDTYVDNMFVIKPKYKQASIEQIKSTSSSKKVNSSITNETNDEEQPLKETENLKINFQEYDIPDPKKYRSVGYDSMNRRAKHYRLFLENELEKSQLLGKSDFSTINISRGKRIKGDQSWIEKVFASKEQYKIVG
jgi:hypothetical protein